MLTGDLVRPRLRTHGTTLSVDLIDERAAILQRTAQDLLSLLQQHKGQSRATWEEAVDNYVGTRIDYVVVRGLAKVLSDAATFTPRATPLPPTALRMQAFAHGPVFSKPDIFHPTTRQDIMSKFAHDFAVSIDEFEYMLFADRLSAALLTDIGPTWTPETLLARYNLELSRGVLYWAANLIIEVDDSYKDLWKFIKLFKLMFWAEQKDDGGYRIELDGPISPFVASSLRYGRQMAAFLPALLLCERWKMRAQVHPPQSRNTMLYQLDHTCSLRSHFKRSGPFDSRLEAEFANEFQEFEAKFGEQRGQWRLSRESEVLLLKDTVMIPDFIVEHVHNPQRRIFIELVGFWHPNYLKRKLQKLREAQCTQLLVLVYQGLNLSAEDFSDVASQVIFFQQKPVLKEVMAAIEQMAEQLYGPYVKPELSLEERETQLVDLLTQVYQQSEHEWLLLAQLESALKQHMPTFTIRTYGYKNISTLIHARSDLLETRRQQVKGRPLQIRLIGKE